MSYNPVSDFLSLSRATASGAVLARAPGLDIVMAALSRAGMFELFIGQTQPTVNQPSTAWLQPSQPSWTAEAKLWLWDLDNAKYAAATPGLWSTLLTPQTAAAVQAQTLIFENNAQAAAAVIPAVQLSFVVIRFAPGYEAALATYVPGALGGPNAYQDAGGRWWQLDLTPIVHFASWYSVNGDNADYTAQLQHAISFANGHTVRLPFGTIIVSNTINSTTTVQGSPGLRLEGAGGAGQTTIDCQIVGGLSGLKVYGSPSAFAYFGHLRGIKFITTTTSGSFLDLLAQYDLLVEDCQFIGSRINGVNITSNLGDADAPNTITFRRCLFTASAGAGLLSNNAPGVVQTSFVRCEDCFFSENGVAGWQNIGLSSFMSNCGFTENGSAAGGQGGLWVVNNAASNAQFTAIGCSFENNWVASARLDALVGGQFIDCEMAGGTNPIIATRGFALNGSSKIRFEGTRVRVGSFLNPHQAWTFAGGSSDNVISNTQWQAYDAAGQVRYVTDGTSFGNRWDDSSETVQEGADNGVMTVACVTGANQNVALPAGGTLYGIAGPGGAFNVGGLTNGYPGRRLLLLNATGQVLTLNHEDAGSTAANRIWNGGAGVAVPNLKVRELVYDSQVSRWLLV